MAVAVEDLWVEKQIFIYSRSALSVSFQIDLFLRSVNTNINILKLVLPPTLNDLPRSPINWQRGKCCVNIGNFSYFWISFSTFAYKVVSQFLHLLQFTVFALFCSRCQVFRGRGKHSKNTGVLYVAKMAFVVFVSDKKAKYFKVRIVRAEQNKRADLECFGGRTSRKGVNARYKAAMWGIQGILSRRRFETHTPEKNFTAFWFNFIAYCCEFRQICRISQ